MTVTNPFADLERAAALEEAKGNLSYASALRLEASQNNQRDFSVSGAAVAAADLALSVADAAGSHVPTFAGFAYNRTSGNFAVGSSFANTLQPTQTWVGGTGGAFAGAGSFTGHSP